MQTKCSIRLATWSLLTSKCIPGETMASISATLFESNGIDRVCCFAWPKYADVELHPVKSWRPGRALHWSSLCLDASSDRPLKSAKFWQQFRNTSALGNRLESFSACSNNRNQLLHRSEEFQAVGFEHVAPSAFVLSRISTRTQLLMQSRAIRPLHLSPSLQQNF